MLHQVSLAPTEQHTLALFRSRELHLRSKSKAEIFSMARRLASCFPSIVLDSSILTLTPLQQTGPAHHLDHVKRRRQGEDTRVQQPRGLGVGGVFLLRYVGKCT